MLITFDYCLLLLLQKARKSQILSDVRSETCAFDCVFLFIFGVLMKTSRANIDRFRTNGCAQPSRSATQWKYIS